MIEEVRGFELRSREVLCLGSQQIGPLFLLHNHLHPLTIPSWLLSSNCRLCCLFTQTPTHLLTYRSGQPKNSSYLGGGVRLHTELVNLTTSEYTSRVQQTPKYYFEAQYEGSSLRNTHHITGKRNFKGKIAQI
jgi:hypothetical protein